MKLSDDEIKAVIASTNYREGYSEGFEDGYFSGVHDQERGLVSREQMDARLKHQTEKQDEIFKRQDSSDDCS